MATPESKTLRLSVKTPMLTRPSAIDSSQLPFDAGSPATMVGTYTLFSMLVNALTSRTWSPGPGVKP